MCLGLLSSVDAGFSSVSGCAYSCTEYPHVVLVWRSASASPDGSVGVLLLTSLQELPLLRVFPELMCYPLQMAESKETW
jgi:hypothetical protein